ncbi:MAG: response regulator [Spirochaetales bacterium]|jgi:putative two-component system response regulator|nr:response regulator [Exilispira sp.]NMC67772.1 response regulator [Spirochaetales bacterium]
MNILLIDDNKDNLYILSAVINKNFTVKIFIAENFNEANDYLKKEQIHLIFLDIIMPNKSGIEYLKELKNSPEYSNIPVIMITAIEDSNTKFACFEAGAVDYITKPFNPKELVLRLKNHLQLISMQNELITYNKYMNELISLKVKEVINTRNVTIFALAKLAESRDTETGRHLLRIMNYCKFIAEQLAETSEIYKIDSNFIDTIYHSSILHDIGKVGIPDSILLKPGKLTTSEFEIIKTHTIIGGKTLEEAESMLQFSDFLRIGKEICFSHHERWDGKGYPYGLKEEEIPLSARIVSLADVFDALMSKRVYKPKLTFEETYSIITEEEEGRFDPAILKIFKEKAYEFKKMFEDYYGEDESSTPAYQKYLEGLS